MEKTLFWLYITIYNFGLLLIFSLKRLFNEMNLCYFEVCFSDLDSMHQKLESSGYLIVFSTKNI